MCFCVWDKIYKFNPWLVIMFIHFQMLNHFQWNVITAWFIYCIKYILRRMKCFIAESMEYSSTVFNHFLSDFSVKKPPGMFK